MKIDSSYPIIVKLLMGSKLFGTNIDTSDNDYKIVFAHTLKSLMYDNITGCRNDPSEDDIESIALSKIALHMRENQIMGLEMLFAPRQYIYQSSDCWEELLLNKDKIVSKSILPFLEYAKDQAIVYSDKGTKLADLRHLKTWLESFTDKNIKILSIKSDLIVACQSQFASAQFKLEERSHADGRKYTLLKLCDKYYEETLSVGQYITQLTKQIGVFGNRAKAAEISGGYDTKAMYHAYRIITEARELLATGVITLPRPDADFLLKIRSAEISYDHIKDLILKNTEQLKNDIDKSTLRESSDIEWIDSWFDYWQKKYVLDSSGVTYDNSSLGRSRL